jgi:eukaryotic-like serine/threonine-protein kinase
VTDWPGPGACRDGVVLAGRYLVGEVVGRGRSAVYRARDQLLGREVALKQVRLVPDPDAPAGTGGRDDVRARARREARAAARLVSPHVVGIYDVVEEPDAVWLVMELVAAPSLERLVRDGGPLDEARAAGVGLAVLDALADAHAQGIVHRDVKPANVLVGAPAGHGEAAAVKLADFGVAALRDESGLTTPGMVIGSPSYMAPEQASAGAVGPAADLWALGALLYFAVEGEPPFDGGSVLATAAAVVHGTARPQRHPGRLSRLIELLLAKDPACRPDAARVRAILLPLAAGEAAETGDPEVTLAGVLPGEPAGLSTSGRTAVDRPGPGPGGRRPRRGVRMLAAAAALVVAVAAALAGAQSLGSGDGKPVARTDALPAGGAPAAADAGTPVAAGQATGPDAGADAGVTDPAAETATSGAPATTPVATVGPTTAPGPPAAGGPTTTVPGTTTTTAAPEAETPPTTDTPPSSEAPTTSTTVAAETGTAGVTG